MDDLREKRGMTPNQSKHLNYSQVTTSPNKDNVKHVKTSLWKSYFDNKLNDSPHKASTNMSDTDRTCFFNESNPNFTPKNQDPKPNDLISSLIKNQSSYNNIEMRKFKTKNSLLNSTNSSQAFEKSNLQKFTSNDELRNTKEPTAKEKLKGFIKPKVYSNSISCKEDISTFRKGIDVFQNDMTNMQQKRMQWKS